MITIENMPYLIVNSIIVAILAAILYWSLINPQLDPGFCPSDRKPPLNNALQKSLLNISLDTESECYFSSDYDEARDQFRKLAKVAGAELKAMIVNETLTTDVAIFKGDQRNYLIHMSGTHGTEAYSGSAVQAAILDYIASQTLYRKNANTLPTLILIHAHNPYGFKYNRRVNEDNIDLNRNVLNDTEFAFVFNRDENYAGYLDIDHLLNPKHLSSNNIFINEAITYVKLGYSVLRYGMAALKKALVSGNYHKQTGVGFGGFKRAKSTENLIDLLVKQLQIPKKAKQVVLVDVHTGLGPRGIDTLLHMVTPSFDNKIDELFPDDIDATTDKLLGGIKVGEFGSRTTNDDSSSSKKKEVHPDAKATASGYELTVGTVSTSFCQNYLAPYEKGIESICLTQEFGTIPSIFVGKNLMLENCAYWWGSDK